MIERSKRAPRMRRLIFPAAVVAFCLAIQTLAEPAAPRRLIDDLGNAWRDLAKRPYKVKLDGEWCANPGVVALAGAGLAVAPSAKPAIVSKEMRLDIGRFTHIRLRMQVEKGAWGYISISSDAVADPADPPGERFAILADGEMHEYLVPLASPLTGPWLGNLKALNIQPSDAWSVAYIASIELVPESKCPPLRLTLNCETRETVFGMLIRWPVDVPPAGRLSVSLGTATDLPAILTDTRAKFTVTATDTQGKNTVVLDETLDPAAHPEHGGWQDRTVDLSAFAGQYIVLSFQARTPVSTSGNGLYWGDPLVFTEEKTDTATPVFLISCDTLRADHLSCYGYSRKTSPFLDAFAGESVLFENALTPEPWTLKAHMSMLTGLYPKHHGLRPFINLSEGIVTLPEVLREAGYLSAGIVGHSWWLLPWRGYADGFDVYSTPKVYRDVFTVHAKVLDWLDRHPGPAPFVFLQNYDLHSKLGYGLPYEAEDDRFRTFSSQAKQPPAFPQIQPDVCSATEMLMAHNAGTTAVDEAQRSYIVDLYDDCVLKVDFALNEFFTALKQRGLYDNTLIIVTADHGEALGEHGMHLHEDLYQHTVRVPLFIRFPRGQFAGTRMAEQVSLNDLFPTVLDTIGMPVPDGLDGRSLLSLVNSEEAPTERLFLERGNFRALVEHMRKLLHDQTTDATALFNLKDDPNELSPVVTGETVETVPLLDQIGQFFDTPSGGWSIRVHGGGAPMEVTFRVACDDPATAVWSQHDAKISWNDPAASMRSAEGQICLDEQQQEDTLVIDVAPEHTPTLTLESDTPFSLDMGGVTRGPEARFELVLDSVDPANTAAAPAAAPPAGPWAEVTYVPEQTAGYAAPELTEADRAGLRALGYVE